MKLDCEKLKKKEKYKKLNTRTIKGITLIALVITIIVLLILAGVSIAMLTGQNGILNQANKAKLETENASLDEQKRLAQIEANMNLEDKTYTDKNGKTVTIPSGFAVSNIEDEREIDKGLVVIDKGGNEFVWVTCTEDEYKTATDKKEEWNSNQAYKERVWSDFETYNIGLESVKKYGGFYVARYEAGIPEEASEIYATTIEGDYATKLKKRNDNEYIEKYIPVSKKGVQAWNCITPNNANKLSKKVISNEQIQSYLIDSNAWDIICKKISKYKNIKNSTDYGNHYNNITTRYENLNTWYAIHQDNISNATTFYKGYVKGAPRGNGTERLELSTGASEDFKVYNIYDMAGNMWEWTTETSTDGKSAFRGGSFVHSGIIDSLVCRAGNGFPETTVVHIGFRPILYFK